MTKQDIAGILAAHGQSHLLAFWDEIGDAGRSKLLAQLQAIDWDELSRLIPAYVLRRPDSPIPADLAPAPYFPMESKALTRAALYARAKARGAELLRAGKVAAFTVAGGQGTRLGFDGPKGTFPITPVKGKSLFQYFSEALQRASEKYGAPIRWYIMTSEMNNAQTVAFFRENAFFGMDESQVFFFTQGSMPAIGLDGKLLLEDKDSLALAPDGHGGSLLALRRSGALDRMRADGVEHISYFQVDNPLAPVVNPLFIGLHDIERSEMSCIMLAKTGPHEKLGNFCVSGGRLMIIEYSDMPNELAESRNPDGSLRFIAGSPAIHVISRSFAERLTEGLRLRLPWHRADKKVPHIDGSGRKIFPQEPNAVKLESFIFDALPLASKTMILEARREEVFAPTKNKTGVDSVESCRAMLSARDADWLVAAYVPVPCEADGSPACVVELSPRRFLDAADVAARFSINNRPPPMEPGKQYYFE